MKKILLILLAIGFLVTLKTNTAVAQTGCTTTPPTNTGRVTLSTTTTAGTYRLWSRMKAASSTANSFYVQVDSSCAILVGDSSSISSTAWTWVDYQNGNTSTKTNINFTAGNHVVTIIGNEPGVGVDKLLLTRNLTCVPTGTGGDNCPAEIPTPTTGPDTTPPVVSAVSTTNITNTGVTITWTLSEPSTGQIEYGTTTSYGTLSAAEQSFDYTTHIQTISGLTPGTTYHYRVKSSDQAGNQVTSGDFTFTTTGGGTVTPVITPTNTPTPIPTAVPTATKTPTPVPSATPTATKTPTPVPTAIPTPTVTPTPIPSATTARFTSIKLHGIGLGGDNTNPNLGGNQNPLRTTRTLSVELVDSSGNVQPASTGNITFRPTTGDFGGDITLNSSIPSGTYLVKIKSPQYLKKQLVGIITITKGTINSLPAVSLVTGDVNNDNALTIADYNILIGCYSDLLPPKNCDSTKKLASDISDDGNVNADDYNLFLRELSVVTGE